MKCLAITILGIVVCGTLCNGQGDGGGDAGGVTMVTGDSNQCYRCSPFQTDSTIIGAGCDDDNFDVAQASIVTCPGKCAKSWIVVDGATSGSVRGCATNDFTPSGEEILCVNPGVNKCESQEIPAENTSVDSYEICSFCCNDDLCNSAGSGAVSGAEYGAGSGAGSVAINTAVILSVTAVSALLVMIF